MNKMILCGRLTKAPEVKVAKSKKITVFSLAINEGEKTTFVDCETWEKTAEIAEKYLEKGHRVLIEGKLRIDTYESKKYPKCMVERIELIQDKSK